MSEELPEDELNQAARNVLGIAMTGDHIQSNQAYLEAAAAKGVAIQQFLDNPWQSLEIDTASGQIVLSPQDWPHEGVMLAGVAESADPSMAPGQVIVIEGLTMTGGSLYPGFIGPGARMAFRTQVVKHYKVGEQNSDESMTLTKERIEEYTSSDSGAFIRTEEGMDLVYFDPRPRGTDFVSHAAIVEEKDGEPKTRYLF